MHLQLIPVNYAPPKFFLRPVYHPVHPLAMPMASILGCCLYKLCLSSLLRSLFCLFSLAGPATSDMSLLPLSPDKCLIYITGCLLVFFHHCITACVHCYIIHMLLIHCCMVQLAIALVSSSVFNKLDRTLRMILLKHNLYIYFCYLLISSSKKTVGLPLKQKGTSWRDACRPLHISLAEIHVLPRCTCFHSLI